ncbi:MAG: hypothetical protein D6781_14210 [Verrucomicrobia bacterium]|nr:MAG: hypothetical protein D6781_14210 [Verrucomicrobiota bacterium]
MIKRIQAAVLVGQILSYGLIVTFLFADSTFNLSGVLRSSTDWLSLELAQSVACLVALIGTINVWISWYYIRKSNTMRDWLVVCAWTHKIKQGDRWVSLEEFLAERLGCQVSHGISDPSLAQMREQLDNDWHRLDPPTPTESRKPRPKPA